jgi:hypothetical protein
VLLSNLRGAWSARVTPSLDPSDVAGELMQNQSLN